jgi:Tol biopolymer transport system component
MSETTINRNGNPKAVISISNCWLLLALLSSLVSCNHSAGPTGEELNVDRDIPPSEAFDASYGFWGPDGESIYFKHSEELGSEPDPRLLDQLWKLDLSTGERQMIHTGRILNADISPDGQWFVFHSFSLPQYLYRMRSDGTDLQRLTGPDSPNPEWEYSIMGKWSPDGDKILFATYAGEPRGVTLMNPDGTNPEIIIPYGVQPNWSPDGNQIIYLNWDTTKVQKDQEQIYIANADGNNIQQITDLKDSNMNINNPSLSPDGTRIVFVFNGEIHFVGIDGKSVEQVTDGLGYTVRPEWSPDGATLLFSRIIPNESKRLYYLDVATREVTPVFPE